MNRPLLQTILILMLPASTVVSGCADDPQPAAIVATATIEHNLAADGCDYLITIGADRYAPDASSRTAINDHHLSPSQTVTIAYRPTGRTGVVECSSGLLHLPEISLELADTVTGRP